jgi:ABC-type glycerol-3-phosphate transport system substrate-binding protein
MPQGMDGAPATKAFSVGQIASQLAESAVVNVYKTNNPATYNDLRSVTTPWPSRKSLVRIHPLTVNAQSPNNNKDAAKEFFTFLYSQQNYRELLERALDVIRRTRQDELGLPGDAALGQWLPVGQCPLADRAPG